MEEKQESWFNRNWKWAVPVGGCGCGCLIIILLFVFGIGAAAFGISEAFNESAPIKHAIELASNNEEVIEVLGDSIQRVGMPSGKVSLSDDDGEIDFSLPIKGLKARGTIIVKGIKADGTWIYEDLYVTIKETQEQINLLEKEVILE